MNPKVIQDQINAIIRQAEAIRDERVTNRRAAVLLLRSNVETLLAWEEVEANAHADG